jgi:AraC-like DNA-binding protein
MEKTFHVPTNEEIAEMAHALIIENLSIYDSIPGLARKLCTNSFKLKKIFKESYGETIFQFSRRKRIERAKLLLFETNYTLQTIGEMVGYSEGNNFQTSFKQVVGCTPGDFRKKKLST